MNIGISFKRNYQGFDYKFNGCKHRFYPDFLLEDGTYVEIKGQMFAKDNAKLEQFPFKIIVLRRLEMQTYLNYVKNKYGKDFVKLYEEHY